MPRFDLLLDDDHYVAVVKPAGMPSIPSRDAEDESVFEALAERLELPGEGEADPRLRVVHRLDKDTIDPIYNPRSLPDGLLLSSFKRGYRAAGDAEERALIARLTLHAEKLRFVHLDARPTELVAPLPKDFRAALNMLRKYGR